MGGAIVAVAFLLFGGYIIWEHRNDPPAPPPQAELVTTAPDGTKLYHIYTGGHDVYFSRGGTEHTESHMVGKTTHTETVVTPNAQ